MADEDDLFAVFTEEDVGEGKKDEAASKGENTMKEMEKQRQQQAKSEADRLINELMSSSSKKRPLDNEREENADDEEPSEESSKKTREEVEEAQIDDIVAEDLGTLDSLPRIQIHEVSTKEKCRHLVAVPSGQDYEPLVEIKEMVHEFPFTLDPFQNEAIACINNNQSVLVSAHTSAGKTVCGLYAIARCLKDKQRVIYTTPIKALSNQKYRELEEEFKDVGLMTGDVTYNVDASCLVMTTEILRSMLYRGSELMREVGWVIFDEIHYMRDKERGVVWEETIILLPDNVHFVFLSATIPNAVQFAEWIVFLHKQPCHVIYTDYRPVPLRSYIYAAGSEALHLVVDEQGTFREDNFEQAMSVLRDSGDAGKGDRRGRKGGTVGESNVKRVLELLLKRNLNPVIVFSFSRKECEAYGLQLKDQALNSEEESKAVTDIFNSAIDVLSDEDKSLEQVTNLLPLLQSGVGIHHSGLLPILKETVEILFGEGLIKCLFATETFSMGLNMPARTVLFTSSRKYDGVDHRSITSGEFIQMSGRAGRRGIDDRGLVILMMDQMISADSVKQILKGEPDPLNSQFRLTYNMILNLLRVEGINPEYMLERSFFQFQNYSALPDLYAKVQKTGKSFEEMKVPREIEIAGFYKIKQQISELGEQLQKIITKPQYMIPFLQPGRLAHVKTPEHDFGWGVVINFQKKIENKGPTQSETYVVVDILLQVAENSLGGAKTVDSLRPCKSGERGVVEVIPVLLHLIKRLSAVRIKYEADLRPMQNRIQAYRTVEEVGNRFPDGFPLLDPVEDMQIKDSSLKELVGKIQNLEERMMSHPLRKDKELSKLTAAYEAKLQAESDWKAAKQALKKAKSLLQMDELKCRKRVLRRLGYANDQDVITIKGRVACEISAADELLLTEMIFNKAFDALTKEQCASLLSCFVFQENAEAPSLSEELSGILRQMQTIARRIAKVTAEVKLPIDEDKYVESFRPHIMDVVHAWCSGASFQQITTMTDCFEGSIIRAMRRLEELMREMVCAAKSIGNDALRQKFEEGISKMKRDIVFAASLYL